MSTKFTPQSPNPNVPVYVRDAAASRKTGKEMANDERSRRRMARAPAGGKGCRKIQRNAKHMEFA